jgi:glycosyltransferase involved in cell wall biosynthesis
VIGTLHRSAWLRRFSALREISSLPAASLDGRSPLKILQLTNMYPSVDRPNWGVFIRSQVDSLARQGVSSDVVEIEGWRSRLNYARALAALPLRILAERYDLLHIHYGLNVIACLGVRGIPTVVSFCGDDFWGRSDSGGKCSASSLFLARLSKLAAQRAQVIIVKSAKMAAAIDGKHPDVEVIPNGVDFEFFDPLPKREARLKLGWPLDRKILLFPANPREPRKNFPLAQAVEARLRTLGRPIILQVVYGRPQRDVMLAMSAADVMLSCSFQEGSPNAVKEAMAMNLPVVSTDVGDCAERLRDCRPGGVVAKDVEAFVAAVLAVLEQGAKRSNGRELAAALDLDSTAKRVVGAYRRAIERFHASRMT